MQIEVISERMGLFEFFAFLKLFRQQNPVIIQRVACAGLEAGDQILDSHGSALCAADFEHDISVCHHECAVSELQRLVHIVGNHQAGDFLLGNDTFCQLQHFFSCSRIEGGGVLIKQQKLRRDESCHEQGKRLALTAGEKSDRLGHPVFKPHI